MKRTVIAIAAILGLILLVPVGCSDDDEMGKDAMVPDAGEDQSIEDMGQDGEASDALEEDLGPQPDQTVDSGSPSAWTEVLPQTNGDLNDVWGTAADNVFAVGKGGLAMNYNGTAWSVMNNPANVDLFGVHGNGQYVYAVGPGGDFYYDGASWLEGYSYSSDSYYDVWAGDSNLFAVGALNGSIDYKSAADPTDWWTSIWDASSSEETMYGIWAQAENEIYVVGESGLILTCAASCASSSSTWTKMTTGVSSDLYGIWGTASDDIFAVGNDGVILHYDGSTWTKMSINTASYFRGVWGSSSTDVYAVGQPVFADDESIFHYNGTAWTKMPPPKSSTLNAVWGTSSTDVWAVGKVNILHYDGSN